MIYACTRRMKHYNPDITVGVPRHFRKCKHFFGFLGTSPGTLRIVSSGRFLVVGFGLVNAYGHVSSHSLELTEESPAVEEGID